METNTALKAARTVIVIAIVFLLGFQLRGATPKAFSKKSTSISFFSNE